MNPILRKKATHNIHLVCLSNVFTGDVEGWQEYVKQIPELKMTLEWKINYLECAFLFHQKNILNKKETFTIFTSPHI